MAVCFKAISVSWGSIKPRLTNFIYSILQVQKYTKINEYSLRKFKTYPVNPSLHLTMLQPSIWCGISLLRTFALLIPSQFFVVCYKRLSGYIQVSVERNVSKSHKINSGVPQDSSFAPSGIQRKYRNNHRNWAEKLENISVFYWEVCKSFHILVND